jgi:hypothetical protein
LVIKFHNLTKQLQSEFMGIRHYTCTTCWTLIDSKLPWGCLNYSIHHQIKLNTPWVAYLGVAYFFIEARLALQVIAQLAECPP